MTTLVPGSLVYTLTGHTVGLTSLATLPNGNLASGSFDNTVKIFDTDRLVKFDVVPFIILLVIIPEFVIPVDDIVVVCNVPLFIILLLIVNDPEQLILLTLVRFPLII
jgi:WD40 repeat protein